MIRIVSKLLVIALVLYIATSIGYARLEKRLRAAPPSAKEIVAAHPVEHPLIVERSGQKTIDYGIITTRNIFQATLESGKGAAAEVAPATESLEPTSLQLSLQGTVSGGQGSARAVILDEKTKKQEIYRVGDSVQGALIKSIERGKIVLQVNGRNEVLLINDRQDDADITSRRSSAAPLPLRQQSMFPSSRSRAATPPVSAPRRRMTFRQPSGASGVPEMPGIPMEQTGAGSEHLEPMVEIVPEIEPPPQEDTSVPPQEMP